MTEPTHEAPPPPPPDGPAPARSNGVAVAALVTGIIALLVSWIPGINLLSFVLGIVAIVTGLIGLRNAADPRTGGRGMSIAGLVTGVLALVVAVLIYVGLASFIGNNPELQEELQRMEQELEEEPQG